MIVDNAKDFIRALDVNDYPADSSSVPKGVLMVEPDGFYVGEETVLDNHWYEARLVRDGGRGFVHGRGGKIPPGL